MEIEKWMCDKCGCECRVEIDFHKIENYEDGHDRFRGRCLAGTKDFPEDSSPEWVRQDGNLDNSAEKTQPKGETNKQSDEIKPDCGNCVSASQCTYYGFPSDSCGYVARV